MVKRVEEDAVWLVAVELRRAPVEHHVALVTGPLDRDGEEAGLADTRLAGDLQHARVALVDRAELAFDARDLPPAPHESGSGIVAAIRLVQLPTARPVLAAWAVYRS